ncbi:hypothetical protein BAE44_0017296, partial [Dichanthelium oligosanthes]
YSPKRRDLSRNLDRDQRSTRSKITDTRGPGRVLTLLKTRLFRLSQRCREIKRVKESKAFRRDLTTRFRERSHQSVKKSEEEGTRSCQPKREKQENQTSLENTHCRRR